VNTFNYKIKQITEKTRKPKMRMNIVTQLLRVLYSLILKLDKENFS